MCSFPQCFCIGKKGGAVFRIMIIGIDVGHSHDLWNIGIRRNRMTVSIHCLDPHIAEAADGPGRWIFFFMLRIFRVIFAKDPFPGKSKLRCHISRCDIGITVEGAGPVCVTRHQFVEYLSGKTFGDIGGVFPFWKVVSQI